MVRNSDETARAGGPRIPWWGIPAVGVVALAHAPLLVLHGRALWNDPQYRGFPLVLAGSAVLAARGGRRLGRLTPEPRAWVPAALALMLLGGACLLFSPWLGATAALATLLATADALGGRRLVAAMLPAWCFLGLCIPPPFGLDAALVSTLQGATARCVSRELDVLGVYHVMEGYLIDVGGRRLMVEEACRGIQSLHALTTCVLFFAIWARRSPARAAALLAVGAVWVLAGNVLRIVAVALLFTRYGSDWSEGWRHEVLGLVAFTLSLGLTYSTDRAIGGLVRWWAPIRPRGEATAAVDAGASALPDFRRTWLASPALVGAFGLLGLLQVGILGHALSEVATQTFSASNGLERRFSALKAETLPLRFGPFDRVAFETERRGSDNSEGAYSRFWRYEFAGREVIASVDYPLRGWHELTECFRRKGWVDRERTVRHGGPSAGGAGGDLVEVALIHKTPGRYGYLFFCNFDRDGRPLDAEQVLGYLRGRLRFWGAGGGKGTGPWRESQLQSVQFQVFVESESPLTRHERDLARAFFDWVRSTLPVTADDRGGAT